MLTWLDQYIKQMGDAARLTELKLPSGEVIHRPVSKEEKARTDFELTRDGVRFSVDNFAEVWQLAKLDEARTGKDFMTAGLSQALAVHPFLEGTGRLLAMQVDRALVEDFIAAKPPEVDYSQVIEKYDAIYLDLPPEVVGITEQIYLRAVILYRESRMGKQGATSRDNWRVFCPLPMRGRKVHLDYQIEIGWWWNEKIPSDEDVIIRPRDEDTNQPVGEGIKASEFREEVEALIKLCLLYYESDEGPKFKLPQVTPDALKRLANPKKARAKHQQATLFSVVQLKSPVGRFGRTDQEGAPSGGWKLGVRTSVRGHFRWQAYGPGWKQHRLKWIAPFERGPKDAPTKVPMHRLKKEE